MIKDGGLSFKTQLKIEFLPLHDGGKNCLVKSPKRDSKTQHFFLSILLHSCQRVPNPPILPTPPFSNFVHPSLFRPTSTPTDLFVALFLNQITWIPQIQQLGYNYSALTAKLRVKGFSFLCISLHNLKGCTSNYSNAPNAVMWYNFIHMEPLIFSNTSLVAKFIVKY